MAATFVPLPAGVNVNSFAVGGQQVAGLAVNPLKVLLAASGSATVGIKAVMINEICARIYHSLDGVANHPGQLAFNVAAMPVPVVAAAAEVISVAAFHEMMASNAAAVASLSARLEQTQAQLAQATAQPAASVPPAAFVAAAPGGAMLPPGFAAPPFAGQPAAPFGPYPPAWPLPTSTAASASASAHNPAIAPFMAAIFGGGSSGGAPLAHFPGAGGLGYGGASSQGSAGAYFGGLGGAFGGVSGAYGGGSMAYGGYGGAGASVGALGGAFDPSFGATSTIRNTGSGDPLVRLTTSFDTAMADAEALRMLTGENSGLGPEEIASILAAADHRGGATAAGRMIAMFAEVLGNATPATLEQLQVIWMPALAAQVAAMTEGVSRDSQQIFATQQFNVLYDPQAAQVAYKGLVGRQPFQAAFQIGMAAGAEKVSKKKKVETVVNPTKDQKEQHYGPGGDKGKNGGRGN